MGFGSIWEDVAFDFAGALQMARDLYDLSQSLDAGGGRIVGAAGVAMDGFLGTYADDFVGRVGVDVANVSTAVSVLQLEAAQWADAWRLAMDEQNWRLRARAVERESQRRSLLEKTVDAVFTGDDSERQIPPVQPAVLPTAPDFTPITGFQCF